jgi:4-hydroxy 2-oxovalerate aldolase
MNSKLTLIDCTLRDGGYYNHWDFSGELIVEYLAAMEAAAVDYVELGFRSFDTVGFRGACAYTTDKFIASLLIPAKVKIGVMMNASELLKHPLGPIAAADTQFCEAEQSPVSLVRFACHVHEFEAMLPVCAHLKARGYVVGINLMQVADRTDVEIENIGKLANEWPLDVLYFADSLGSLDPDQVAAIVRTLKLHWKGDLGIHTHDNMGRAVANTFRGVEEGVTWVDSTVTGMGRGPGNAQTEYVAIEVARRRGQALNLTPLLSLIRRHFGPMRARCGWGSNPYYYLAGQYGIHPTYVQEMLSDPRYGESEILSVLEHLRSVGGKKFSPLAMEGGRQMYGGDGAGSWEPALVMRGREVLVLGAGASIAGHRAAIEDAVKEKNLFVITLNTQQEIAPEFIDLRAACHPFRLLADCNTYRSLKQPIVLPNSRTPQEVQDALNGVDVRDFGLVVQSGVFEFHQCHAVVPTLLVIAYVLAMATSGGAKRILMAGFDGFAADDSRSAEMAEILANYQATSGALPLLAITPTRYNMPASSVYAL